MFTVSKNCFQVKMVCSSLTAFVGSLLGFLGSLCTQKDRCGRDTPPPPPPRLTSRRKIRSACGMCNQTGCDKGPTTRVLRRLRVDLLTQRTHLWHTALVPPRPGNTQEPESSGVSCFFVEVGVGGPARHDPSPQGAESHSPLSTSP